MRSRKGLRGEDLSNSPRKGTETFFLPSAIFSATHGI